MPIKPNHEHPWKSMGTHEYNASQLILIRLHRTQCGIIKIFENPNKTQTTENQCTCMQVNAHVSNLEMLWNSLNSEKNLCT